MLLDENAHPNLELLIITYKPACSEPLAVFIFHNVGFDTRYRPGYVVDRLCCFNGYISRSEQCVRFLLT